MREYAKVQPTFWIRGSGKKLRGCPEAQIVALYLFSAPSSSMLGLFYCPVTTIAHETGLPIEGASKGLRRVVEAGIAHYCEEEELVFLPAGLRISVGPSLHAADKRVVGLIRELQAFGKHKFVRALLHEYGASHHLRIDGVEPSPIEAPSEALRSQEQEQEKEQEQDLFLSPSAPQPTEEPKPKANRKKPPTPLPPDADLPAWLAANGIPERHPELAGFLDHHRARDNRFASWSAAWGTWLRNAEKFARGRGGPARHAVQPISSLWEPKRGVEDLPFATPEEGGF